MSIKAELELLRKMETDASQTAQLLDYQINHAKKVISILNSNGTALDASDPGVGKTYIASFVCKQLNLVPIVICPKNVISRWRSVLEQFQVNPLFVSNYELICRGKYSYKNSKIVCPYIQLSKDKKIKYTWTVDKNVIFIFDEVHKCKFISTLNARILVAAKETGNKILMLSATVVEKPLEFAIFAYVLGLSSSLRVIEEWIRKLSNPSQTIYSILYNELEPLAARLTIQELGDKFPETQITADTYEMKKASEIQTEYRKIAEKIEKYKNSGEKNQFIIAQLQSEFRNIELLKIPTFVELTEEYLENNYSIVIFVNYTDTLKLLSEKLKTDAVIYGGQSLKDRDKVIERFQSDEVRVVIANIKAGGVGISLHDINGKYPRVALISPTTSATNLIQALGRIHRSGGKSKSLQRIIFAAHTPEEMISRLLFKKLANLSVLNDGEMETYYIEGLLEDETVKQQMTKTAIDYDKGIPIDEQLEKIKKKNFMKVDYLSQLFPKLIDTISEARNLYLLKGRGVFSTQEILLLGENHYLNDHCARCDKNCIEASMIITYCMYALRPNQLDFYIEKPYNPYNISNKFLSYDSSDTPSRLTVLYNSFRHLINSKYPATENLRMHAVDVRDAFNEKDELLVALSYLVFFTYEMLGHAIYDIMKNFYDEEKEKVFYKKGKEKIDLYCENLRLVRKFLQEENYIKLIKIILSGDSQIMDLLKINKQKDRVIESHGSSKDIKRAVEKLDKDFRLVFEAEKEVLKFLMSLRDILDEIKDITTNKKYINKFFKLIKRKLHLQVLSDSTENDILYTLMSILSNYVDMYSTFRMLRKFDNKEQKNIIFYGGAAHVWNIKERLIRSEYFTVIVKQKSNENDLYKNGDCQHLMST